MSSPRVPSMSFSQVVGLFCVSRIVCECKLIPCDKTTKTKYFITVIETDPPGTDLQFNVEVKGTDNYWTLEIRDRLTPKALEDFFLSAMAFEPSEAGEPLRCSHAANLTSCKLTLTDTLDAEVMMERFRALPPSVPIEFRAKCRGEASELPLTVDVYLHYKRVNEFSPHFKSPLVNVTFPREDLVAGFRIFSLLHQATDGDAGREGEIFYSVFHGKDIITVQRTRVILIKSLTGADFLNQTRFFFLLIAEDNGKIARRGNMTLVLIVGAGGSRADTDVDGKNHRETDNITATTLTTRHSTTTSDKNGTTDTGALVSQITLLFVTLTPSVLLLGILVVIVVYVRNMMKLGNVEQNEIKMGTSDYGSGKTYPEERNQQVEEGTPDSVIDDAESTVDADDPDPSTDPAADGESEVDSEFLAASDTWEESQVTSDTWEESQVTSDTWEESQVTSDTSEEGTIVS